MAKVVVLGAGFAGVNVCLNLIGTEHEVELLDAKGSHEYTPGVIDLYRERVEEDDLRFNLNQLFEDTEISFSREKVENIDPKQQLVETNAGNHEYSYLVVALGSQAATFGMDISAATECYDLTSAKKSVEEVEEAEKVTVIGSGYVGVEVAGELSEMDKDVSVVDGATRPMPRGNEDSSQKIIDYMNREDIDFRGGSRVKRVESGKVVLENGKTIRHDAAVWCAGVEASKLVQDCLDVGKGGVEVDDYFRWKKYPEVFSLGDCADLDVKDTAHNAMHQAEKVAKNIGASKQDMETIDRSSYPLLVSLGDTGLMLYGDKALKNRFFRKLKDYVRLYYGLSLKKQKLKGKIRSLH